ncbi:hypothetical protein EVB61_139 [Rhizobium phage RHph_TM21B]|nr:hypothetical protein EVB61_139 [Rhizobium phage RHph_TM21B]
MRWGRHNQSDWYKDSGLYVLELCGSYYMTVWSKDSLPQALRTLSNWNSEVISVVRSDEDGWEFTFTIVSKVSHRVADQNKVQFHLMETLKNVGHYEG